MHDKEKLSMYVDITKITIIICWVSLIGFWLLKIFGGNFFEIMVKNENFLKFSDLLQNTWLKYLVSFVTIFIYNYLIFGAVSQNFYFKGYKLVYVLLSILMMWLIANFVNIDFIKMYTGYILIIIFSLITQTKWKKLLGFSPIVIELIFSILSMMTRNIDLVVTNNYLVASIMMIDLYIMAGLYYLYSNFLKLRKEM